MLEHSGNYKTHESTEHIIRPVISQQLFILGYCSVLAGRRSPAILISSLINSPTRSFFLRFILLFMLFALVCLQESEVSVNWPWPLRTGCKSLLQQKFSANTDCFKMWKEVTGLYGVRYKKNNKVNCVWTETDPGGIKWWKKQLKISTWW